MRKILLFFFKKKENFLKKKESSAKNIFFKLKNKIIKVNNKILFITDIIYNFYKKYLNGKAKLTIGKIKIFISFLLKKAKNIINFIVNFYKKDKIRAIIYFIVLYVIYKLFYVFADKISMLMQNHRNEMRVLVREVKAEKGKKNVNCYGFIESENNLQYFSEVRGNVDKIFVEEKQYVKEGQLIMSLDSKFTINSYVSAKSILESKKLQFNAIEKLYREGLESKGNLKIAEADLETANSNFETAKKAYNGLMIKSPFNGYIDNITNKEKSQINIGTLLFTLERENSMQVKCDVTNVSNSELNIGDNVDIFINGYQAGTGEISVIGNTIDVYSGARTIIIKNIKGLEGFEEFVKPGTSVNIKMVAHPNYDVFKISSEALENNRSGSFMVKILNPKDNSISKKDIFVYEENDGINYVIGLKNGDYVIERGHEFVDIGEKNIKYSKIGQNSEKSVLKDIKKFLFCYKSFYKNIPEFGVFLKNDLKLKIEKIKNVFNI